MIDLAADHCRAVKAAEGTARAECRLQREENETKPPRRRGLSALLIEIKLIEATTNLRLSR
jgi:hypothetical protein